MYMYTYVYMHMYIYIHIYTYMSYICMYVCMYISIKQFSEKVSKKGPSGAPQLEKVGKPMTFKKSILARGFSVKVNQGPVKIKLFLEKG